MRNIIKYFIVTLLVLFSGFMTKAQKAYFADGYHGGVYGHFPSWQAKFMIDKLTEFPQWKINLEIEPETWDSVYVNDRDNFNRFQEYYASEGRRGKIEFVNPAYAQPYGYNISGESIIRHFAYGIAKTLEYFPDATFTTYSCEEPCFTSSLPQILKGFGFKFAVLRNPNTCWGGYTTGFGKDLVNWIGPDGTSIPSVPRYEVEKLVVNSTWQTTSWNNSNEFLQACLDAGIQYPVGMCFQDAGWDNGPWLGSPINGRIIPNEYVLWTEYIDKIIDEVEVVDWHFSQEDVKPGLVWGAQILQKLSQEIRVSENKLILAEKMAALDYLLNGKVWPVENFSEAWRTLMLAQHHDCWIVPYNVSLGNTWADKVTCWTNATNNIVDQQIEGLFDNNEQGHHIRVYNTLGFFREDVVEVPLPQGVIRDDLSVAVVSGTIVDSQIRVSENGNATISFVAKVPAFGYATYQLTRNRSKVSSVKAKQDSCGILTVDTEFYTAIIDPQKGGVISSLIAKKLNNVQLVERDKGLNNLGGHFYDKQKFIYGSDSKAIVSIHEQGPLYVTLKVVNQIDDHPYIQKITFWKDKPIIDFDLEINWNGQPRIGQYDHSSNYQAEDYAKAFYNDAFKLHLQFPFSGIGERLFKNAPYDILESELENSFYSSWDSIKHNVILNWVDVINQAGEYGVALFSDHTTSYLNGDNLPLGLTVQYVGNGLWGGDYQIHGPTQFSYSLLPHMGDWEVGGVDVVSSQWCEPLVGRVVSDTIDGSQKSLFEIKTPNVQVSSVNFEGDDMYIRLFNTSSNVFEHLIEWNVLYKKIEFVDLKGNVLSKIEPEISPKGPTTTMISIPRFGIKTIKLTDVML